MMNRATGLASAVLRGERAALARAISLVESVAPQQREQADILLQELLAKPAPVSAADRLRIGISGPPGAGKSTLIEALGTEIVGRGHKLAVLAVDPSSRRSGGSILGDKTRMPRLSSDPRAYVRPSPARGALGGVAPRTEDSILLCECAGYDRVIVETVGVGQSEVDVARMCDLFVLLVPPAAGDELQGIKRGIMELADVCLVTKADGSLRPAAAEAARQLRASLKVLRPRSNVWTPRVLEVSSLAAAEGGADAAGAAIAAASRGRCSTVGSPQGSADGSSAAPGQGPKPSAGASEVADLLEEFRGAHLSVEGGLEVRRRAQAEEAVREHAWSALLERLAAQPDVEALIRNVSGQAAERRLAMSQAGAQVASRILKAMQSSGVRGSVRVSTCHVHDMVHDGGGGSDGSRST